MAGPGPAYQCPERCQCPERAPLCRTCSKSGTNVTRPIR
jgi:hypothetical protein